MLSRQGDENIMAEALAVALPTPFAQRGATSLRALSMPRPEPPFRPTFLSTYWAQTLPASPAAPRILPSWSFYLEWEASLDRAQGGVQGALEAGGPGGSLRSRPLDTDQKDGSE